MLSLEHWPETLFSHAGNRFLRRLRFHAQHNLRRIETLRRRIRPKIFIPSGVIDLLVCEVIEEAGSPRLLSLIGEDRPSARHFLDDFLIPWAPILKEGKRFWRESLNFLARQLTSQGLLDAISSSETSCLMNEAEKLPVLLTSLRMTRFTNL